MGVPAHPRIIAATVALARRHARFMGALTYLRVLAPTRVLADPGSAQTVADFSADVIQKFVFGGNNS